MNEEAPAGDKHSISFSVASARERERNDDRKTFGGAVLARNAAPFDCVDWNYVPNDDGVCCLSRV